MHPGDVNNGSAADRSVVVVRWTAPEEGLFTVAGAFYGMDRGDKHVAIVHDGLLIGEAVIAGSVDATFNFDAFVAAGGVLDFVVENNGVFDFDTTGLDVNISPVPTPGCAALLSIGGLAAFRRRRN